MGTIKTEARYKMTELTPKFNAVKSFYEKAKYQMITKYISDDEPEGTYFVLYSYNKAVALVDVDTKELKINFNVRWDSQTTLRHIKEFNMQFGDGIMYSKKDLKEKNSFDPIKY